VKGSLIDPQCLIDEHATWLHITGANRRVASLGVSRGAMEAVDDVGHNVLDVNPHPVIR